MLQLTGDPFRLSLRWTASKRSSMPLIYERWVFDAVCASAQPPPDCLEAWAYAKLCSVAVGNPTIHNLVIAFTIITLTYHWTLHNVHHMTIWWKSGRYIYVLMLPADPWLVTTAWEDLRERTGMISTFGIHLKHDIFWLLSSWLDQGSAAWQPCVTDVPLARRSDILFETCLCPQKQTHLRLTSDKLVDALQ